MLLSGGTCGLLLHFGPRKKQAPSSDRRTIPVDVSSRSGPSPPVPTYGPTADSPGLYGTGPLKLTSWSIHAFTALIAMPVRCRRNRTSSLPLPFATHTVLELLEILYVSLLNAVLSHYLSRRHPFNTGPGLGIFPWAQARQDHRLGLQNQDQAHLVFP